MARKQLSGINQNNTPLINVPIPTSGGDAANKTYVDKRVTEYTVGATDGDFPVSSYSTFSHAVNAALAVGDVFIKAGTYNVPSSGSVTITPVNNRKIRGAGMGRTIIQSARPDYVIKNVATTAVNDFSVEDLTIDTQNGTNVNGIRFSYATRCNVRRVEFKNNAQWMLIFGNEPSATSELRNYDCVVEGCVFDTHSSIYEMLLIYNSINTRVSNNIFRNNVANSPTVGLWQLTDTTLVENNRFYSCLKTPIYYSNTSDNLTITNNYFENCGSSIVGGNASDNGLLGRTYAYNLRVNNNTFLGGSNSVTAQAIQIGAIDGFQVNDNKIELYETGIKLSNGNTTGSTTVPYPSKNGTISRNIFKNLNPSNDVYGLHNAIVFLQSAGDNTDVNDNKIIDDQSTKTLKHAISFNTTSSSYDNIRIYNNDFKGTGVSSAASIILNNSVTLGSNTRIYDNTNYLGTNPKQSANVLSTGIDASNNKITNLSSPTSSTDAVNKDYVDSLTLDGGTA